MMWLSSWGLALLAGVIAGAVATRVPAGQQDAFRRSCLSFQPERLVFGSNRTRLEYISAGTNLQLTDNVPSCARPSQNVSVDICRIALQIPTSERSGFSFELWLPRHWEEGRYLATGNGGIDGCIKYEDLAYGTAHGFATMGTNNGHNGSSCATMYHNPDVVTDFSYRALHAGTVTAKKLISHFYQIKPRRSYYLGCSLGGRMGIKAAEKFPDDYDGIVAGCPAVDFNNLNSERAMFYPITGPAGSPNYISTDTWKTLIHDQVLQQCDGIDGVLDGIIEDPSKCHFDPGALLCGSAETSSACLNSDQVEQLRRIYAPYTYANGTLIFPRMNPGNEIKVVEKLIAGAPFQYSQDWFQYVVLDDPAWDALTFDLDDAALAEAANPANIRTWPSALPRFRARGGKLLSYHGGQDNQITSFNTARFWDRMQSHGDGQLLDWYRFFRVSGMYHCNTGPGAWVIGQGGNAAAEGIPFSGQQNVLAAMVDWVEKGIAPESLTGTKFVNDDVAQGIDFQRSHCLYPREQTYIGGDYKNPGSWRCE